MILIFTENISYSARYVARHLLKMKQAFGVFLETDQIDLRYDLNASGDRILVYRNGIFLCEYAEIKAVWAHRSDITIKRYPSEPGQEDENYERQHQDTQLQAIRYLLHQKKCLGRFGKLNFNKLIFLNACKQLKLRIPNTLVTRKKEDLMLFFQQQNNGIIVKSIAANLHHCVSMTEEEQVWQQGITNSLDETMLDQVPETFELSLFQEKLNKKYELRVLYVAGTCFSQVIFSQRYAFSEVDYRQGLGGSKMRQCNFKLPQPIIEQINGLMNALDLNIGCIDIVVTKADDYVFLEVNPSGIFTDMMDHCNYDMHDEIAKYLAL